MLQRSLPELETLRTLIDALGDEARVETLTRVALRGESYPVLGIALGSTEPTAPTLAIVGGVHGVERIGAQVALSHLETIAMRLGWDEVLRRTLEHIRLVYVPLVNPGGTVLGTRANPNGVDLMRNAPVHLESRASFLVGGQRLSPILPWYMGNAETMEPESAALCAYLERQLLASHAAIAVDCHSGFGLEDRLWFPYARTRKPFPNLPEVLALAELLDGTSPNHVYRFEPQAQAYTIVGDLWDHMYDQRRAQKLPGAFVPLTLEMGSWMWVRKNPLQALYADGTFNPIKPHRLKRTLRRHLPFFDFLVHAVASPSSWIASLPSAREQRADAAFLRWYG
jgi:hypothetical protein